MHFNLSCPDSKRRKILEELEVVPSWLTKKQQDYCFPAKRLHILFDDFFLMNYWTFPDPFVFVTFHTLDRYFASEQIKFYVRNVNLPC